MDLTELKPAKGAEWARLAVVAVVAAAVVIVVTILDRRGSEFEVIVKEGAIHIVAHEETRLSDIVERAIEEEARDFADLAARHDYYHISSRGLVDKLATLHPSADDVVTAGLRELLWDLKGPFATPGTFSGADARLIEAVVELDDLIGEGGSSGLLADLLRRSLSGERPFHHRRFNAEVVRLPIEGAGDAGARIVYACPPGALDGLGVTLIGRGLVTGLIDTAHPRLDCRTAGSTLPDMIAGEPVRLGLDAATYAELMGRSAGDGAPAEVVEIGFNLHPRGLTPEEVR